MVRCRGGRHSINTKNGRGHGRDGDREQSSAPVPAAFAVAHRTARGGRIELRVAGRHRLREYALMVVQGALVFALVTQSVLLLLVLQDLFRANVGFQQTNLIAARVQANGTQINPAAQAIRYAQLASDLQQSGIRAATISVLPLTRYEHMTSVVPARRRRRWRSARCSRVHDRQTGDGLRPFGHRTGGRGHVWCWSRHARNALWS